MSRKIFIVFVCLLILFVSAVPAFAESYAPSVANAPFVPYRVTFTEYGTGDYYGLSSAQFGTDLMQYTVAFDNNVAVAAEYSVSTEFSGTYGSEIYGLSLGPVSSGSGYSALRFSAFQVGFPYLVPIYCSYENLYNLFYFNSAGTTSSGCVVFGLDTSGQLVSTSCGQASSSSSTIRTTRLFTDSDARRLVSIFGNGTVIYMVNASLRYQVYMASSTSQPFAGQVEFFTPVGSYESVFNSGYSQLLNIGASQYDAGFSDGEIAAGASFNADLTFKYNEGFSAGYSEGLQQGEGEAYDQGYQDGYLYGIELNGAVIPDFTEWAINTLGDILELPIFGTFSLGSILVFAVMLGLLMIVLRFAK